MDTEIPRVEGLRLEPHPSARSRAVSECGFRPGSIIVSESAMSTILFPSEKGRRCDACHSLQPLRKCSGCVSYWYCGTECERISSGITPTITFCASLRVSRTGQNMQWKAHHKKLCKWYRQFTESREYQRLSSHKQLDAILLSHLIAEYCSSPEMSKQTENSALGMFLSLREGPHEEAGAPPVCPMGKNVATQDIAGLYSRFGNNNFAVHSHLTAFAHGIFPLSSRLFNHSCAPNAAAKYIIKPSQSVSIVVVALSPISSGEEVRFGLRVVPPTYPNHLT
jgi:hypothetical protein